MVKKLYITALSVMISLFLGAQADCVIQFKYIGIITSNSLTIEKIGLPSTAFLVGYENKRKERAFAVFEIKDSVIDEQLSSHLSSEFCRPSADIIHDTFKKPKNNYTVKVFGTKKDNSSRYQSIEVLIPVKPIKFTTEIIDGREVIVIDLGHISA